jgi:hypothetical protein
MLTPSRSDMPLMDIMDAHTLEPHIVTEVRADLRDSIDTFLNTNGTTAELLNYVADALIRFEATR